MWATTKPKPTLRENVKMGLPSPADPLDNGIKQVKVIDDDHDSAIYTHRQFIYRDEY